MSNTITMREVAEKVVELADANPEFVYMPPVNAEGDAQGCQYVHRNEAGEPIEGQGCIVGRALAALGVRLPIEAEGTSAYGLLGRPEAYGIPLAGPDNGLRNSIDSVQCGQDNGVAWGEAANGLRAYLANRPVAEVAA